jgi:CPA1 family monovalent cation:H+ antiporter
MLGLLLFAGALHVKLSDLRREWVVVMLMATIGIGLSTVIVGIGFSWLTGMPLLIALLFGALISPTDPVAVLGVLRKADLEKSLETKNAGESLFSDGVSYVVFLVLIWIAFPHGNAHGGGLVRRGATVCARGTWWCGAGTCAWLADIPRNAPHRRLFA